jgi:hypothetical protein
MTSENLTTNLIENFSTDNLQSFFRQKLRSFRSEREDYSYLFDGNTEEKYTDIYKLGEAELKDSDELLVFSAQTQSSLTYKTGKRQQFEMAKKVLQNEQKDAAFFIFYDEEKNFRFSFVKANFEGKSKKYTDFKRYTYFVSKEQSNRTFIQQTEKAEFSDIGNIIEAFSIEPLNKQFYKDISDAFNRLTGVTENKKSNQEIDLFTPLRLPSQTQKESTKTSKEFAVRLIGRIIFVWFLKNKVSENGTPLVPTQWLNSKQVEKTESYYHFFLEKLFFQVLNKPLDERFENILEDHQKIPFLNGGLFEAQEEDYYKADKTGLSTNLNTLVIPNNWIKDFFETLERYNFTIDENSLSDQEVSIDPEMLGTIFEKLLGDINPETEKSDRKSTGSFYTPRIIVDYMVEESLITYLQDALNDNTENTKEYLRQLFKEEVENIEQKNKFNRQKELIEALNSIKILDPACGSGAFPIGALQRINFILQKLDSDNEIFKDKFVEGIPSGRERREKKEKMDNRTVNYLRKFGIVRDSIFGVDIQAIAIEIAKLRCFLTLIVDEPVQDDKPNRGITPLPNLEFKFVTANTLITVPYLIKKTHEHATLTDAKKEFSELTEEYFDIEEHELKEKIRKKITKVVNDINDEHTKIIDLIIEENEKKGTRYKSQAKKLNENEINELFKVKNKWNSYKNIFANKTVDFFDVEYFFPKAKEGFDIVIGNPPYISADSGSSKIDELRKDILKSKEYATLWEKWDIYVAFIEQGYKLLAPNGILTYIIPDAYMASKYAKKSHDYFTQNAIINRINFLAEIKVFDAQVKNIIIEFKKAQNPKHKPIRIKHIDKFENQEILETDLQTTLLNNSFLLNATQKTLGNFENTITWEKICYVSVGMVLQANELTHKGDFTKKDLISDIFDDIHSMDYVEAKWIKNYKIDKIKYLEWDTERVPSQIRRPTFFELYTSPKLLLGGMTGSIYDDRGLLCNHSCFVSVLWKNLAGVNNLSINNSVRKDFKVKGKKAKLVEFRKELEVESENFDLKYLLAILNSKFGYYFLNSVRRSQMGFYPDDLKKLPIKSISAAAQTPFINLVNYILWLKSTSEPKAISVVENEAISYQFEKIIDVMVFELYFSEEMKENKIDILQFITSQNFPCLPIAKDYSTYEDVEKEKAASIGKAYQWFLESDNPIRNRMILLNLHNQNWKTIINSKN